MKRYKHYIFPAIMIIIVILLYLVPPVFDWARPLRHLIIYTLIGYGLLGGILKAYDKLEERIYLSSIKKGIFFSVSIVVMMMFMFFFGKAQLYYIEHYEIPPLIGCDYFDSHENLIYSSLYEDVCPELLSHYNEIIDGRETLIYQVEELAHGTKYDPTDSTKYQDKLISEITIQYNNKEIIERITLTTRIRRFQNDVLVQIIGYQKTVDNTFEENVVTSTIQEKTVLLTNPGDDDVVDFNLVQPQVTTYISKRTPADAHGSQHDYLDITKQTEKDGELIEETLFKGERLPGRVLINRYENGRYDGQTTIYSRANDRLQVNNYFHSVYGENIQRSFTFTNDWEKGRLLSKYDRNSQIPGLQTKINQAVKHYPSSPYNWIAVGRDRSTRLNKFVFRKKAEYYNNDRKFLKKYPEPKNNGGIYSEYFTYRNDFIPYKLRCFHDYGIMLDELYPYDETFPYYQFNPLIDGFDLNTDS